MRARPRSSFPDQAASPTNRGHCLRGRSALSHAPEKEDAGGRHRRPGRHARVAIEAAASERSSLNRTGPVRNAEIMTHG
jgi:hypothetical protein